MAASDIDRLAGDLDAFADRFSASVSGVASDIAWATDDRVIRERTILWRLRAIPAIRRAAHLPDSRLGLLQSWVLCEQLADLMRTKPESELFGPAQPRAIAVTDAQLEMIESIARKHVPADRFAEAEAAVAEFADQYPIRRSFALDLIADGSSAESKALLSMLAIPVSGLSESADSIDRLARVAAVFTEVVDELPQIVRWQAELLLLEVDSLDVVRASQASFERFAASAESMSRTAEELPQAVRRELEDLLETTGPAQEDLRRTVGDMRLAIADADAAIVKANETAARVERAAAELVTTADAWREAANAVQGVTDDILAMQAPDPDPDPDREPGRPFDVTEYEAAAREIRDGAAEIRAMLDDIESGKLTTALQETDLAAREAIDHAAARVEGIVRDASVRLVAIGGALVAVLIIGQLLVARAARRG